MSGLAWARVLLLALAGVVLAVVGGVLLRSWQAADQARVLRHQLVAERLFDSMERELTDLLADEEARPFVSYRAMDGIVGERPPHVVGWFQVDPEGRFTVAHPLDEHGTARLERAAEGLSGWGGGPPAESLITTVRVPVQVPATTVLAAAPTAKSPPPDPAEPEPRTEPPASSPALTELAAMQRAADNMAPSELPVENSLNNGFVSRGQRGLQRQQVSVESLANFENPSTNPGSLESPPEAAPPEPAPEPIAEPTPAATPAASPPAPKAARKVWVPVEVAVPTSSAELVDVTVSPFTLDDGPEPDTLLLHRVVSLGGRRWVQGLLIDDDALQDHLIAVSLAGTDLETAVRVDFSDAPPAGAFRFAHPFHAPFDHLHGWVVMDPLPGGQGQLDDALLVTAGVLVLLVMVGLVVTYRLVLLSARRSQQREDFVSAITHELKSPLTAIRMYSEMLESGMASDPEQARGYHRTIRLEAERLTRLVDDVLLFSNLQRGVPAPAGTLATLDEVVGDVLRLVRPVVEERGAQLVVDVDDAAGALEVDRDALSQVLANLLDNALKFSLEAPDRRIHLIARAEGGRAIVQVRDHGPGVPRALLRRIFQPFERGERELTRKTKGTGIGLALVQKVVVGLGGEVAAENHPDGGLVVTVGLPV